MKSTNTLTVLKPNPLKQQQQQSSYDDDKSTVFLLNPKLRKDNKKDYKDDQNISKYNSNSQCNNSRYSDTRLNKYKIEEPRKVSDDRLNLTNIGPILFESFTQTLLQTTGSTKRFFTLKSSSADVNLSLYAYYQQATNGICNIPQPSCLKWLWTSSNKHKRWQAWKNLGDMPKQKAVKKFIETLFSADPNIFTKRSAVIHKLEVESTYRLRELSKNKKIAFFIKYYPKIMKAIIRIQSLYRMMKAKMYVYDTRIQRYYKEFKEIIKLLITGIRITKIDGKSRLLILDIDKDYDKYIDNNNMNIYEILNKSRIKISNPMSIRGSVKFLFLSDVAEIRNDGNSYCIRTHNNNNASNNTNNDKNINHNNYISIIGLDKTLDFTVNPENLPKNKTKSWLIKGLYLLVDLSLSPSSLSLRGYYKGERSFQKHYMNKEITSKDRKDAQLFLRILKKGVIVTDPNDKSDDDHLQLLSKPETKLMIRDITNNSTNSIQSSSFTDKYSSAIRLVLNDKSIDPLDISEIRIIPHPSDYYGICIIGSELSLQFTYSFNTSKYINLKDPNHPLPLTEMEFVRLFRAFLKVYKRKFYTKNTINIKKKGSKSSIISATSTFTGINL